MKTVIVREFHKRFASRRAGMELVQVAILVAIAIVVGLIFRSRIEEFVENVFANLSAGKFL